MNYFSVACIAKDEELYIEEWVNYHRAVGADHIYIYDNLSKIPIKQILSKYIEIGIVTVIEMPGTHIQSTSYNHCLKTFGYLSKWIAFSDVDEFLVPKEKETLSETLQEYEQYGGLVANWLFFGSGNLLEKPKGLTIENFIWASERTWCLNSHIKSIVQPEKTLSVGGDPHWFNYKKPFYAVSESGLKAEGSISHKCESCISKQFSEYHNGGQFTTNKIQLNHYYTKSLQEYKIRMARGPAYQDCDRKLEAFFNVSNICNQENKDILKFINKTKSLYL